MKNILLLLIALLPHSVVLLAQSSSELTLRAQITDLEIRVQMLEEQITNDTIMIEHMSRTIDEQQVVIDSLCKTLQIDQKNFKKSQSDLKNNIDGNHEQMISKYDYLDSQINKKSLWAGLVGIGAIILSLILYLVIRRKNRKHAEGGREEETR